METRHWFDDDDQSKVRQNLFAVLSDVVEFRHFQNRRQRFQHRLQEQRQPLRRRTVKTQLIHGKDSRIIQLSKEIVKEFYQNNSDFNNNSNFKN